MLAFTIINLDLNSNTINGTLAKFGCEREADCEKLLSMKSILVSLDITFYERSLRAFMFFTLYK